MTSSTVFSPAFSFLSPAFSKSSLATFPASYGSPVASINRIVLSLPSEMFLNNNTAALFTGSNNITLNGNVTKQAGANDQNISNNDYSPTNGNNAWNTATNNIVSCGSKYFAKTINLPSSGWNGTKYLIFKADGMNNISETNENNNLWIQTITIGSAANGGGGNNFVMTPTVNFYASYNASELSTADLRWISDAPAGSVYEVEHSADGINFQAFTSKEQDEQHLSMLHRIAFEEAIPGMNYFRVRLILPTGEIIYSQTEALDFTGRDGFVLAPNPSAGRVRILMKSLAGKEVDLVVSNPLGVEVYRQHFEEIPKKTLEFDFGAKGLKDGIYTVSLVYLGRAFTQRLVLTGTPGSMYQGN